MVRWPQPLLLQQVRLGPRAIPVLVAVRSRRSRTGAGPRRGRRGPASSSARGSRSARGRARRCRRAPRAGTPSESDSACRNDCSRLPPSAMASTKGASGAPALRSRKPATLKRSATCTPPAARDNSRCHRRARGSRSRENPPHAGQAGRTAPAARPQLASQLSADLPIPPCARRVYGRPALAGGEAREARAHDDDIGAPLRRSLPLPLFCGRPLRQPRSPRA